MNGRKSDNKVQKENDKFQHPKKRGGNRVWKKITCNRLIFLDQKTRHYPVAESIAVVLVRVLDGEILYIAQNLDQSDLFLLQPIQYQHVKPTLRRNTKQEQDSA